MPQEWDANGKPITAAATPTPNMGQQPTEWDASGKSIASSSTAPAAAPQQGGFLENLLPHSIMHPIDSAREEFQESQAHPVKSIVQNLPGVAPLTGLYEGAKRSGGELLQAGKSLMNGNPAEAASHAITAVPIAGPALKNAAEKPDVGGTGSYLGDVASTLKSPSAMGTLTGAAAQIAPMLLSGADAAAPTRTPIAPIAAPMRAAAIGDTDAAALRGLRVPPSGKKVLPMQNSVNTARPYLQGASSLEDLQSRIPTAKTEAFAPYKQTLDAVGDNPVKGPDGMTTIRALEDERQELSAMNRGLKSGDPSALRLAEQKGMSQADSLAREKAIQSALDPELSRYGIDPQGIRNTYGAISRVGNQVEGRSTLLEKPQPSGFGKMLDVSLKDPKSWIGQPMAGVRDLVAGRPMWSASPTDVGIREGFANAGPKPDFGQYTPFKPMGQLNAPPIELGRAPEAGGTPEDYRPPNFYHDTTPMRTGRLLNAPPIELGGSVEGPKGPAFRYDTAPMRMGRILPDSTSDDMPLSSHSDIFQEQRPQATRIKPKVIEGKK